MLRRLVALLLVASPSACSAPAPSLLTRGHSHNDYQQTRPLLDALDRGYMSVEADVFLVDGELLVAHDRKDCRKERTLRAMYLEPLAERAARGGKVYAGVPGKTLPVALLIDIKTDGEAAYAEISRELAEFPSAFTSCDGGVVVERAVTVVISGDIPRATMTAQRERRAFVDGRAPDLDGPREAAAPPSLVPVVSLPWTPRFAWIGLGPMPTAQRTQLRGLVAEAHARGYRIRFWGTPNLKEFWETLLAEGVDVIGVDDLPAGERVLQGR